MTECEHNVNENEQLHTLKIHTQMRIHTTQGYKPSGYFKQDRSFVSVCLFFYLSLLKCEDCCICDIKHWGEIFGSNRMLVQRIVSHSLITQIYFVFQVGRKEKVHVCHLWGTPVNGCASFDHAKCSITNHLKEAILGVIQTDVFNVGL